MSTPMVEVPTLNGAQVHIHDVKLAEDIFLVSMRQHRWQGEHVLDQRAGVAVAVKDNAVEPGMVKKVSATLIPKPLQKMLGAGYAEIDRVIRRYTYDFAGAKAVSAGALRAFFQELDRARGVLAEAVAAFRSRYQEEVVEYNRTRWEPKLGPDLYEEVIGKLLPQEGELSERFRISVTDLRRLEAPDEQAKFLAGLDASIIEEIRKHKTEEYTSAMDALVEGPRKVLAEAIERLTDQIRNGEILRRDSFNAVLDAIALNRAFAGSVTDEALLETSRDLEEKITDAIAQAEAAKTSTNTYSDLLGQHAQALLGAIQPVAAAANNATAVAEVRRKIRVRTVDVD
jgi:hypothetical protein